VRLFLIDGHALVFKMYYAFLGRPMINSKGVDTSILFGFTKYLLELIEKEKPTHLAVSFDPPGGTFRNKMYPEYKANRGETPQLVIDALEPLTRIVQAMNIPVLMLPGYEADDVIGSAALRFSREGMDVYMVTPDKDYGQLVGPHVWQYRPGKAGGGNEILSSAEICEKWGISSTSQVVDILAICGDAADNVPGVQGVGPVGAAKLLQKYGSVESIYEHLGELTARQQQQFEEARGHISLSKELVTIKTDIPLDVTAADMEMKASSPEIMNLFNLYEFGSLKKKLQSVVPQEEMPQDAGLVMPAASGTLRFEKVQPSQISSERVAVLFSGGICYLATSDKVASGRPSDFKNILEDPSVEKAGSDMKTLLLGLAREGIVMKGRLMDVSLMHYLVNPERSHKTDMLARTYLGVELDVEDASKAASLTLFDDVPEEIGNDRSLETVAVWHIASAMEKEFRANPSLEELYVRIEEPLLKVLARMEKDGVKIDLLPLKNFADGLRKQMLEKEAQVRSIAGIPDLNISSPKQIGEVIFEKLALDPKAKRPKGSWPTDEQTLSELADRSPIINAILDYRGLRKLLSTYIEPLPSYINPADGRVHTTFNQTLTSTGRLSSSNPNLQNIPVRTEQGREIRKAFVAGNPDWVMMSADYSQIELRIMAHLCADRHMVEAFNAGTDVHSATASKIFGIPVEDVTAEQRRIAKTANFGIMYGISSFGLSQRLGCSRSEAKSIIDDYFASFPSIKGFIEDTLVSARENGYVETIFGRRRYVPDVNSHNGNVRALAERNAVNAPIQGSAADIIKLAMIEVENALEAEHLRSKMVLQIHDELLLEVPPEEVDVVKNILVRKMEGVVNLSVPLTVECNYGKSWLEAH